MNISRVVDSISKKPSDPDSHFRMRIAAIEGDSLVFGMLRPYKDRREGVDFSRFVMRGVRTRIDDFAIAGDTIRMNIDELSCTERSGWRVADLRAHPLTIARSAVCLDDVEIRSEGSALRVPSIRLIGERGLWRDFSEFSDSVSMNITMRSSRVTTDLVGQFVPAVRGWGVALDNVGAFTRGVLAALSGGVESARMLDTNFAFDFSSRGLPHLETAEFDARLSTFDTVCEDIESLVRSVTGQEPSRRIMAVLERMGALSLTGGATGKLSDFAATGRVFSLAGEADLEARVTGCVIDGRISSPRFDLGRVLARDDLGAVAGSFTVATNLGADGAPMARTLHGNIGSLGFRSYTYRGLEVAATLGGDRVTADITVHDPNLEADMKAMLDRTGGVADYTVDLDLRHLDLVATHLNSADSVSMISGRLRARMSGTGLDDANGRVELLSAAYRSQRGSVETTGATLEARSGAAGKSLTLRSEFVDAEARSRTGYRDMMTYLGHFLQRYIPMQGLAGGGASRTPNKLPARVAPEEVASPGATSNYSIVSLNVKDPERLMKTLAPSATIAPGAEARFMFNPYTGAFSLSAASEFVEWGGVLAADISLTADNAADSLVVHLAGSDLYTRRGYVSRFEIHGGSKVSQRLDVALDGRKWHVAADSVNFARGRTVLENMRFFSTDTPGERLSATGIVSASAGDTLHVRLDRFDLAPLGGFLPRDIGRDIEGLATGRLDVAALLSNPRIDADVALRGLAAGGHRAPALRFVSHPERSGGGRFRLSDEFLDFDYLSGTLSADGGIDAVLRLDNVDASLLDPLLGGILDHTSGKTSARLTIDGTLRAPQIDGSIDVSNFETTVSYTGARYGVAAARLTVDNSILVLPRTAVTNSLGGEGDLEMRIDVSNLRNIAVEIEAHTRAMLAFDTGPGDSEAFYGRVFATGSVGIRADRMATRIDISARTDAGTQFHLPLNAKSNVSWADFVVFADSHIAPDTTNVLARKRLVYERRLAENTGVAGSVRRSKPLELNLTASITPAAELHMLIDPNLGPGITGRGEGVIGMKINPQSDLFTMTGDYNISSGRFEFSMMDVFNKTFEISPGSTLRWSGAADDALLSVDASYRVRTSLLPLVGEGSLLRSGRSVPVDCIIRLRESLSEPEITFDIALPSADAEARQIVAGAMNTQELKSMQFLSLLTTGSFATDNSITGQSANAGVMATGAVGFDILTNQLNNFLSSEDYAIYFRYRPQDNFASSQVEAGFSTQLWDNRLQLEIEGNWVDDRAATTVGVGGPGTPGTSEAASNLAGDVSLTWVIDRAGNLRLKVFSQTIDRLNETRGLRLNETQGLQESGLGIYYKKDFDTFGDIFRRKKPNFVADSITVARPKHQRRNNK
jgi:hypothetical protein